MWLEPTNCEADKKDNLFLEEKTAKKSINNYNRHFKGFLLLMLSYSLGHFENGCSVLKTVYGILHLLGVLSDEFCSSIAVQTGGPPRGTVGTTKR